MFELSWFLYVISTEILLEIIIIRVGAKLGVQRSGEIITVQVKIRIPKWPYINLHNCITLRHRDMHMSHVLLRLRTKIHLLHTDDIKHVILIVQKVLQLNTSLPVVQKGWGWWGERGWWGRWEVTPQRSWESLKQLYLNTRLERCHPIN